MSSQHHPGDEILFGYASGELSEPMALVVATHLALCPSCRQTVAEGEALGGALLEGLSGELQDAARLMDGVEAAIRRAGHADHRAVAPTPDVSPTRRLFPQPLAGYVGGDCDTVAWKALAPGIRHAIVAHDATGATARLLRIEPGRAVFEHGHGGTELTLVLQGSYSADGRRFLRGDIEQADDAVVHRPRAGDEAVCICLAVTDAPLRFKSRIGRVLQPLFGI
jgi:putative transcriptional regulator